jgi:polysaccharide biosynthesis protein PslG
LRPRWGLALVALVALVAALIYALTTGGTPPRSPDFGADMGVLFQDHDSPAVVDRALASAAAAGLGVARVAPLWELTEPMPPQRGRHRYDWRYDDFIAKELAGHGFRWVAVLAFAPSWASVQPGVLHAAPRGTAAYAAYAAAVARRYRGLISAFEVWNEEDLPVFWRPGPDPATYARLYEAARTAIHHVDPAIPVLIGGLAGGHPRFLNDLLRQPELRDQVDGVAIHTYAATPARMLAQVRTYRLRLEGPGFGAVPLYVTEYGWSSRPIARAPRGFPVPAGSYAPPSVRPGFIVQAAQDVLASGCNVRMAIFYAWVTPQHTPVTLYQWYGVAAPDGAATPASRAIAPQAGLARVNAAGVGSCLPQG